jgi:hypothetical protein
MNDVTCKHCRKRLFLAETSKGQRGWSTSPGDHSLTFLCDYGSYFAQHRPVSAVSTDGETS